MMYWYDMSDNEVVYFLVRHLVRTANLPKWFEIDQEWVKWSNLGDAYQVKDMPKDIRVVNGKMWVQM